MSTALAIAGVTAVLKDLLHNGVIDHDLTSSVGDVTVSALPPDRIPAPSTPETSQLNLFLFQVTPNSGWRNVALPSRSGQGERLTNPPLALDLHYLLTAYGAKDLHAEILLGYAMQLMHETPVLTRDAIRRALTPVSPVNGGSGLPPTLEALATSDLAEQVEQIKLTPELLSTEEISKLWAACQAHYRPTAAYLASVVLIESRRATRPALPVRDRNLVVRQFLRPVIEAVEPQQLSPGAGLTLKGRSLKADTVLVRFPTGTAGPTEISESRLTVTLPAGLRAGINTVQVVHPVDFGTPNEPHHGFESNVAAFMVTPVITSPLPLTANAGGILTVSVSPPVGRAQRAAFVIGPQTLTLPARDPAGPATTTALSVTLPAAFLTGSHLFRVQIDGAESPLVVDALTQEYIGPLVNVT